MARNFHVFSNIVRLKYFTEKTKIKYAFDHFVRESINDIVLSRFGWNACFTLQKFLIGPCWEQMWIYKYTDCLNVNHN